MFKSRAIGSKVIISWGGGGGGWDREAGTTRFRPPHASRYRYGCTQIGASSQSSSSPELKPRRCGVVNRRLEPSQTKRLNRRALPQPSCAEP